MRWVLYPIAALIALVILGLATLAAMALFAWPNLPALDTLTDYRPRVPLRVYTADGHLIGEFGEERRDVVRIAEVPSTLKHAILAAEDERFYEHKVSTRSASPAPHSRTCLPAAADRAHRPSPCRWRAMCTCRLKRR